MTKLSAIRTAIKIGIDKLGYVSQHDYDEIVKCKDEEIDFYMEEWNLIRTSLEQLRGSNVNLNREKDSLLDQINALSNRLNINERTYNNLKQESRVKSQELSEKTEAVDNLEEYVNKLTSDLSAMERKYDRSYEKLRISEHNIETHKLELHMLNNSLKTNVAILSTIIIISNAYWISVIL